MADPTFNAQLAQVVTSEASRPPHDKPVIIGLYGVPGSGKTYLLNQLKEKLGETNFTFFEGSQVIDDIVLGGLTAFKKLNEQAKLPHREQAISVIQNYCAENDRVGVVAGHFMFWGEGEKVGTTAYTQSDLDTYSHIIYLDVPAEIVAQRRSNDTEKPRPEETAPHLCKWQEAEKTQLRRLCRDNGILFSLAFPGSNLLAKTTALLRDFRCHTETYNMSQAKFGLDDIMATTQGELKTMLVMDADKTLATEDTGALFWKLVSNAQQLKGEERSVDAVFRGPLQYTYTAFRQATLLYEEVADDQEFGTLCEDVALEVKMHPEMMALLRLTAEHNHIGAVIVTCGLRHVWEKVLKREGLSGTVKVIGGGRISDGLVITAPVKGAMVTHLQYVHGMYVWAFGDSPLDLEMLGKADEAIIIVGEEGTRSRTMDTALLNAINNDSLQARQAMLPSTSSPRLDTATLPRVELTSDEFTHAILSSSGLHTGLRVDQATAKSASKLLATPMRNAAVAGPELREAHRRVGWYLAVEYLADIIGLEECQILHVQDRHTNGFRLQEEKQTTIVALMRGGEPMALGVSDAFPLAMFVHASDPVDLKHHHVQNQTTVVLVDSVVNSGKTIIQFVQHVRRLHATIRIVVVAGVVQAQCISQGVLDQALARHRNVSLVTLRTSQTKFTGTKTTDTGNRLFNTTHLA